MDNIKIKDINSLIEQSGNIAQLNQNILSVKDELVETTTKIRQAWASDTIDKESYLKMIENNLLKIDTLVVAIKVLSNNLTMYANKQKNNANN